MDVEQLKAYVELGERRHIEGKQGQPWGNADFRGRIVKTVLAMSNLPEGGVIIIGVEEDGNKQFARKGVAENDIASLNRDDITNTVGEYADPPPELRVSHILWDSEKYVAIEVSPFKSTPTICKKQGPSDLKRGIIYTRSMDRTETHPVPSEKEMREILKSALVRTRAEFARMLLQMGIAVQQPTPAVTEAPYDAELGGLP